MDFPLLTPPATHWTLGQVGGEWRGEAVRETFRKDQTQEISIRS